MRTITSPPPQRDRPPAAGIAAPNSPPLLLPAEHFAAALGFWVAGAVMLTRIAPELAAGAFWDRRVAAATHLFTLGWITTSIIGALYQIFPVVLGVPVRSVRAAHVSFALYVPGLALFVAGVAGGWRAPLLAGVGLLAAGLLVYLGNAAATLQRARDRSLTWWALAAAHVFLLITLVLGASLAGNLHWNWLGGHRILALGVHLHVALFGWVMLVVIGVGHQLLPMFLLSHGERETAGRAAVWLVAGGAGSLAVLHHNLTPALVWIIGGLLAGGVAAFFVQALVFFRHRLRPALDPGLRLAALGLLHLPAALPLGALFLARGAASPRIATAYVATLLLGAVSLFVAGHHYKILPFLVWLHRYGPRVGKREVPRVVDLYDTRVATAAAVLLGLGAAGVVAGTLLGMAAVIRGAAASYAAGAAVLATQMLTLLGKDVR